MGKKKSKRGSKNGKSKKNREKNVESNVFKEQQEKTSFEDISQIFLGTNPEQGTSSNIASNKNPTENISETIKTNTAENISQPNVAQSTAQANATESTAETTSADINQCYEEIKAKQQQLLNDLRNLSDSIAAITLTRDNVASLRVDILSNIYFTRQVRPLIDAVNLITFASSSLSNTANNINTNAFGDKKEIKNAFKLVYKMNGEVEDLLDTLTRRIKLYVAQLDNMDKNCPPFDLYEDS